MINPIPAVIVHSTLVTLVALAVRARIRFAPIAIALAVLAGIGASLLWRELGLSFWFAWTYGLWKPVMEGQIVSSPDSDTIKGFLAFWILPVSLSFLCFRMTSPLRSKKG